MNSPELYLFTPLKRFYSTQLSNNAAIIKLPVYVKQHVERSKRRDIIKQQKISRRIIYRGDTRFPVIASNIKENDYYLGQIYNEQFPIPLISKYWFKQKSSGQKFRIQPWDLNPSLPIALENKEDIERAYFPTEFSQLNLNQNILRSLEDKGYKNSTPLQNLAIPGILSHRHVLCTAETGCGKTIGYLAPIFHQILEYKKRNNVLPDTPLAVVMVPGRELAEQIAEVGHGLGESCNISVKVLISEGTKRNHLKPYHRGKVDVLVASVGTLERLLWGGIFKFGNLQHLVLDEADTLLDDTFIEDVTKFLKFISVHQDAVENDIKPHGAQLICVSSTLPTNFNSILPDHVCEKDIVKIKSPYLHRIQPHVLQKFWRVSYDSRSGELLDLVKNDFKKKIPVLVFCNKSQTCDWMSLFLKDNGVPNERFHAGVDRIQRSNIFDAFQSGDVNILCCTDLASRGLDTQRVQHVINFDFPNNVSDYILRAGRVGRVGTNHGHLTNLIVSVPAVYTLQEIEMAVRKSTRIQNVDANIRKKIKKLFYSY